MRRSLPFLAVLGVLAGCHAESLSVARPPLAPIEPEPAELAQRVPLRIGTARGTRAFSVEVAQTEGEQAQGLMFRRSLARGRGMLFPMSPPRPAGFWMKNTLIPLDMLFIRADGTIARIAARTVPLSLDTVASGEPVAAVLELGGGEAARQGIAAGDRVSWPGGPAA